jgi:N-acetylglucosamine malate deacetylase 1
MNILVIAPHADDEVLGCGGLIAKRAAQGHDVYVVIIGLGGLKLKTTFQYATERDYTGVDSRRYEELKAATRVLGVRDMRVVYPLKEMRLDSVSAIELVTRFDDAVNEREYTEIYIPCPSVNHDHEIVYKAMLAALRPSIARPYLKRICAYEYALSSWPLPAVSGGNLYVDITCALHIKLQALACYASQKRPYPHPCDPAAVEALAHFRGMESGVNAAEMFYILRELESDTDTPD